MIIVNGETLDWRPNITVTELLKIKNYIFPMLIVTINNVYVKPVDYNQVYIPDNATIQVTHLISGG